MEKVCKRRRMTKTEQPNEMQLDVYVRARMRKPVAMETAVRACMCVRCVCLPLSTMREQAETGHLLSEIKH